MARDTWPAALGVGAAGALLLLSAPSPVAAVTVLADSGSATDPTAPVLAVVTVGAWALAAWLGVVVLATALGHLPGVPGHACAAVARHVAPSAVRRAVEVALGLGLATGALGAGPASAASLDGHAAGQAPGTAASAATTVTPTSASVDSTFRDSTLPDGTSLDWPRSAAPDVVVVQPGDTLWALAERDLHATTGAPPSVPAVAWAWPAWWSANREVIGGDPDLILPGTVLSPPRAGGPP